MSDVLGPLVDDGEMTPADADHIGRLIGEQNARRAYRLEEPDVAR